MSSIKVAITIERETLAGIDGLVARKIFPNRSRAIQAALAENLERMERRRSPPNARSSIRNSRKRCADEGLGAEAESRPEYEGRDTAGRI